MKNIQKKSSVILFGLLYSIEGSARDLLLSFFLMRMRNCHGLLWFRTMFLLCLLFILLSHQVLYSQPIENSTQEQDVKLVWSAKMHHGEQIYYSSYEKEKWLAPVQLSDSADLVFQPAVGSGSDGKTWVVWSRQDKNGSFLQFTVYNSSCWTKPLQIDTGMNNNKAVTIIVDRHNIPWIAWTAIENIYPDIFWSRWNGQGWDLPVKAHSENEVPNLQPTLALDELGNITLSWLTYNNRKYVTVSQVWAGRQWQMAPNESEKNIQEKIIQGCKAIVLVPDFVEDHRKATLFIRKKDSACSLPLSPL